MLKELSQPSQSHTPPNVCASIISHPLIENKDMLRRKIEDAILTGLSPCDNREEKDVFFSFMLFYHLCHVGFLSHF